MTNPEVSSTNHPSDETLAAFVDGRLDAQSRQIVVEHIATCEDCRAAWEAVSEFAKSDVVPDNVRHGSFGRRGWYSLTAAAAAIAVGFLLWPLAQTRLNRDALMEASASRNDRPSLARLSGEHPYRDGPRVMRNGDEKGAVDPNVFGVYGRLDRIEDAATKHRTAENLRQLAAIRILAEQWDGAVLSAEEAIRLDTKTDDVTEAIRTSANAPLLIDLSAAYFARATHTQNGRADFLQSYAAAKRAWKISKMPAAAWNLALAAEQLGYMAEAKQIWSEYLQLDPSSEWATEARRHSSLLDEDVNAEWNVDSKRRLLAALRVHDEASVRGFVSRYPAECRSFGEEDLLGAWGDDPTEANLTAAELLGNVIAATSGDLLLHDATSAIRAAPLEIQRRLAVAHAAYRTARRDSWLHPSRAVTGYLQHAAAFASARSPFAALVALRRAGCSQRRMAYAEALDILNGITDAQTLAARGYLALAAQVEWTRGTIHVDLGIPDAALHSFESALMWFSNLRERPSEANMRARAAQAADMMAESDIAMTHRLEALRLHSTAPVATQESVLMEAAPALSAAGYGEAAVSAFDRLIQLGHETDDAFIVCYGLLFRSLHYSRHGQPQLATRDFDEAVPHCRTVSDPSIRARATENEAFVAGMTAAEGRPAMAHLDRAIEIAEATGSRFRRAVLYAQRSRLHLAAADVPAARADAARAMDDIRLQLQNVKQAEFRASWVDATRELVSSRIDAELAANEVETAFAAAEWHRAQALADAGAPTAGLVAVEDVRRSIAVDAAVLAYYVGAERLTMFVVRRIGAQAFAVHIDGKTLEHDIAEFRNAIEREDRTVIESGARALHKKLIAPVRAALDGVRTLLVVPDGVLTAVPFVCLIDDDGRMLLDRFTISTLPSVGAWLARRACLPISTVTTPLLIAGARQLTPQGRVLPEPDREIRSLTSLYGDVAVLRDETATPRAVLQSTKAEVIHYTGHAVSNERRPALSAIVLPAQSGGTQYLYAHQIARRDWSGVRALVLAGCSTGRRGSAVRPLGSLAHAFVMAGVGAVVATLWDVDDGTSRIASLKIHANIQNGDNPAEALRQMQLAMRNNSSPALRSPRVWAAWTTIASCDGHQ